MSEEDIEEKMIDMGNVDGCGDHWGNIYSLSGFPDVTLFTFDFKQWTKGVLHFGFSSASPPQATPS